jgi:transcriptional regulator with XRE-family HTH domain
MTLREWMARERLTQMEAAERLDLSQAAVSALANGGTPTLPTAGKIHRATAGAVGFWDWLPPEDDAPNKKRKTRGGGAA